MNRIVLSAPRNIRSKQGERSYSDFFISSLFFSDSAGVKHMNKHTGTHTCFYDTHADRMMDSEKPTLNKSHLTCFSRSFVRTSKSSDGSRFKKRQVFLLKTGTRATPSSVFVLFCFLSRERGQELSGFRTLNRLFGNQVGLERWLGEGRARHSRAA